MHVEDPFHSFPRFLNHDGDTQESVKMLDALQTESFPFQPYGWSFAETTSTFPRAEQECVLLVDDEPTIRTLGKMTLSQAGYRVLTVSSGEDALKLVRTQPEVVDLMILDLVMPGLTGQETLERLQRETHPPDVLVSSGYSAERLDPDHLDHVLGFLKKPYRPSHLLRAVRQCLDERARRRIFDSIRSALPAIP